jgi:hypothetical protein
MEKRDHPQHRKEVNAMTYSKPEIVVLGNAARLIQIDVGKSDSGDAGSLTVEIMQNLGPQ